MNGLTDISNSFNLATIQALQETADSLYVSQTYNPYLEPVDIPEYNSGDATHVLITTSNGNYSAATFNNPSYQHFYIEAGDYGDVMQIITESGTSTERKTISLYNNTAHPASLPIGEQANVRLYWNGASYWDVDGITFGQNQEEYRRLWFWSGASYNTLNRIHMFDFYYGIKIVNGAHYNTIQNSYLALGTHNGRMNDCVAVAIHDDAQTNAEILGTKVINCDIKNSGDAIQLVRSSNGTISGVHYDGTIIDSNRMWIDDTIYCDSPFTAYDPLGEYAVAENPMDMKAGSADPLNPVIITNNKMWGSRWHTDQTAKGDLFSMIYEVENVIIENNVMFDACISFATGAQVLQPWATNNVQIRNNIIWDMEHSPSDQSPFAVMSMAYNNNMTMENNTIIETLGSSYGAYWDDYGNSFTNTFNNNLVIDGGNHRDNGDCVSGTGMYEYGDTTNSLGVTGTIDGGITSNANMTDYSFQYDIFTASPQIKTLTGVVTTTSSPHFGVAGSDLT